MNEQQNALTASWIWLPNWIDSPIQDDASHMAPDAPAAGRLVTFFRNFDLPDPVEGPVEIHITADTRYKLIINGHRVMLGPARSDPKLWFYDTLDIEPFLQAGINRVEVEVMRWFKSTRSGMPFARAPLPGLSIVGEVGDIDIGTIAPGWTGAVRRDVKFPMSIGLGMDVFLHISEHVTAPCAVFRVEPIAYNIKTLNGELAPWHLSPRQIPLPETSPIYVSRIHKRNSQNTQSQWLNTFREDGDPIDIYPGKHYLELEFDVHSTAFVKFKFSAGASSSRIRMKVMYSEGYELEPIEMPFKRRKADRADPTGLLLGPEDELDFEIAGQSVVYEPFWFRTFKLIGLSIETTGTITLERFDATQTNYPMDVKTTWGIPLYTEKDRQEIEKTRRDRRSEREGEGRGKGHLHPLKSHREDAIANLQRHYSAMMDISIRTLRNCMYDGYSDCPFYEQLMYSGDSRSVGLFHYYLSGDDRLMRMAINLFATSYTIFPGGGLTQSRFPSHVPQYIAGFPLYFIMMINDHFTWFADRKFTKPLLPIVDGILTWFDSHVDELGLVSGIEEDIWQYVDWVDTWAATDSHPDKGVPSAGRKSNRHTFFSMIYAYTLGIAADLTAAFGRNGTSTDYHARKSDLLKAINNHCWDAELGYYTDSTVAESRAHELPYVSQHCQVWAVLCGARPAKEGRDLLRRAFTKDSAAGQKISKCSYVMLFYAFRAISLSSPASAWSSGGLYEQLYPTILAPWKRMVENNMTTWEEDDVRQRSDCHAWGSVPIYEFSAEVAGLTPGAPGWEVVRWNPRVRLADQLDATICLGKNLTARVKWHLTGTSNKFTLDLSEKRRVAIGNEPVGSLVDHVEFTVERQRD